MEYPRYISSQYSSLAAGASTTLPSQNFVLPCIPDLIYIYARPAGYDYDEGDWHFPISNFSLNFDNFSGLMSSYTKEELYQMSVSNGLDMDYGLWTGKARLVNSGATGSSVVATVGGGLLIKPGKDFALSAEQAPGLLSNINIQFQVGVENTTSSAAVPVLYMITINSGFFESSKGQSRILRGILNGADVLSAPFMATNASIQRYVGGGIFSSLGNILSKAKDIYVNAGRGMITAGYDGWMISHKYSDPQSFDQDLVIEPVANFIDRVWFDPASYLQDKSDAQYAFLIHAMSVQ
jgi:hypothetical protein